MTRARLIAGAACLVLACGGAPAQAASPRLTEAAGAQFPDRELVLTLPTPKALAPGDVSVSENGAAVSRLQVLPADQSGASQESGSTSAPPWRLRTWQAEIRQVISVPVLARYMTQDTWRATSSPAGQRSRIVKSFGIEGSSVGGSQRSSS